MSYPWITAILEGTGLDPLDEDACLPLPVSPEELAAYLQTYPKATLWDLQDCQADLPIQAILQPYHCTIYDFISEDCSLEEVNRFLWAAYNQPHKGLEDGFLHLLALKKDRGGGKLTTADMMEQAEKWNACLLQEADMIDDGLVGHDWEQQM